MNKVFLRLFVLILTVGIITGCGSDSSDEVDSNGQGNADEISESQVEESVVIVLSKDEGAEIIAEEEVTIEEGDILLDVMKEHFDVEEDGGFITSIEGISPAEGEQKAWMYFVNDEMPTVGAHEYELSPGEQISFDLQAW